jgi:Protein of unknown function (DUF2442)
MLMIGKLETVSVLSPRRLRLAWDDGRAIAVDLTDLIAARPVLSALRDAQEFASVRLSADRWSLEWPSGVDFGATQLRRWAEEQATALASSK